MKSHVEVIISLKSGSVDNIHIYCLFEAADSIENMMKVWLPFDLRFVVKRSIYFLVATIIS